MAKKSTRTPRTSSPPAQQNQSEIRIKEEDREDYFKQQADPYVLPPELNMTIKDGFRFGIGFVLAMLVFYAIALVGVIILVKFGSLINLG